jgi:hypothetical protein
MCNTACTHTACFKCMYTYCTCKFDAYKLHMYTACEIKVYCLYSDSMRVSTLARSTQKLTQRAYRVTALKEYIVKLLQRGGARLLGHPLHAHEILLEGLADVVEHGQRNLPVVLAEEVVDEQLVRDARERRLGCCHALVPALRLLGDAHEVGVHLERCVEERLQRAPCELALSVMSGLYLGCTLHLVDYSWTCNERVK